MMNHGAFDARAIAGALALTVAGCGEAAPPGNEAPAVNAVSAAPASSQAPAPTPAPSAPPGPSAHPLTAAGYDTIRIGAPPSEAEGYELGDDGSYEDSCRIYMSERLPGFYAIVENGRVMRLTAYSEGEETRSSARTDRGIGVGSTEAEVRAAYTPLEEQPHHYVEPPAKDLFFGGTEQTPGLRFEIGADGRVTNLHAGLMPALAYVEGCS